MCRKREITSTSFLAVLISPIYVFFPSTTFVSAYVRARGVFEYITYPVIACIAEATLVAPVIVYRLEFVRSVLSAAKAT